MTATTPPKVLLTEADEGPGFCVSVLPPPTGPGHDQCFQSYIGARTYARMLRWSNGWQLVDRVDPKTKRVAEERERERLAQKHG